MKLRLVPRQPLVDLGDLMSWLSTQKAVTAIGIEKRFRVGILTSKEIIDGLVGLGYLKRGSFFFPVNQEALAITKHHFEEKANQLLA